MTQGKKKRRAKPGGKQAGCPLWMMTFGDAMSLLVTFFVMLIAFSSLEEQKLADLVGVLRGAFGAMDVRTALGAVERLALTDVDRSVEAELLHAVQGEAESLRYLTQEEMADMLPEFVDLIRDHQEDSLADRMLIQMLDNGLTIVLQTSALFEPGTATWLRNFDGIWAGIASLLLGRDNEIRITSVINSISPVQREIAASSWGLGIVRADLIAREMEAAMRAPPQRFFLGVQTYHPIRQPDMDEFVEIMILDRKFVADLGEEMAWPTGVWR